MQIYAFLFDFDNPDGKKYVFLRCNQQPSIIMQSTQPILSHAVHTLHNGGTLLYPTDTIWGIGCDACNAEAVEKIYQIKQRDHSKSMLVLCRREWLTSLDPELLTLLDAPRPTTVILNLGVLDSLPPLAGNLPAADGTIGVRVPRHALCQQLLATLGHPLVSTSANRSGQPSPASYDDIDPSLFRLIDCCLPNRAEWESGNHQSSRIVKLLADGTLSTLRD